MAGGASSGRAGDAPVGVLPHPLNQAHRHRPCRHLGRVSRPRGGSGEAGEGRERTRDAGAAENRYDSGVGRLLVVGLLANWICARGCALRRAQQGAAGRQVRSACALTPYTPRSRSVTEGCARMAAPRKKPSRSGAQGSTVLLEVRARSAAGQKSQQCGPWRKREGGRDWGYDNEGCRVT
jgi:hypothetical protein